MNEALILLLVIFIRSQSDGILVPNPNTNHHFQDSQLEGWNGGEFPYAEDVSEDYKKRSLTNDAFTRRSALDKNFMRFGRGGEALQEHRRQRQHSPGKLAFYRFVRGLKDNFVRFGRGGEKSGFIRFGRTRPEDFFRAGKSLRENFIRFGKADKSFMRFGRERNSPNYQESLPSEELLQGVDLAEIQNEIRNFGRGLKNATNLVDFGKDDWDNSDEHDDDSAPQKEIKRRRRRTQQEHPVRQPTLNHFTYRNSNGVGNLSARPHVLPTKQKPVKFERAARRLGSGYRSGKECQGSEAKQKLEAKMKLRESKEELLAAESETMTPAGEPRLRPETSLTPTEKQFLLYAERGDTATVRRLLEQFGDNQQELNINCVDSLRRSALISAIENENIDLIRLLLEWNIKVKDALLHAIKEEYVEAVELLLEWEEKIHVDGQPYSWEAVDSASATFTSDMTPLILAAHKNNYEIIKILLDRGATLPRPHNVRCGCDECIASSEADSLRHSQARINAYRALTASSLIALSSEDPLLTAFELSRELRNLSYCEAEFRAEYKEMRLATQDFATALLNHVRTSSELEEILNFNADGDVWESGERQTLARLKLAIKYKQKKFVAHPNVQQLLASIWYDGLPGFRRKSMPRQVAEVVKLACLFPFYSFIYMIAPTSQMGLFMKKPFVKFIFHSSSYTFFLMLLGLASQRAEHLLIEWVGNEWLRGVLLEWRRKERGSLPGAVEMALFVYVASLIYSEMRALWTDGLREYIADLWNIVDFITNCFYLIWICLRFTAIYIVERESWLQRDPYIPRENWHPFDPILLSEGAFAAGMIFSFLKLVHIFSVNPYLGPLQISLGRMIIDILKFFFIYTLVLFAFGCGMNQLMWYYAKVEKSKCYGTSGSDIPDFENNEKACTVWRRFANLFETSQSLFWASFGLVDLTSFDLTGIKSFTRFWGLLLFGCYSVVNIIVLLNMLIAMMSNSYQIISERSDVEWKFARSHLWMSYFDEGDTLPPPFNLMPTIKTLKRAFRCGNGTTRASLKVKSRIKAQERHRCVISNLIARYVTAEQRKRDDYGITEDDVIEIRHDISTLKYELIHILRTNGMNIPETNNNTDSLVSKKGKVMERRLIKDFRIGVVEGTLMEALSHDKDDGDVFSKIARVFQKRASKSSKKKDWNALVRKSSAAKDPIGTTEERRERLLKQSLRRYILTKSANVEALDPEKLVEYNPKLSDMIPAARVAYAKFNINKIRQEFNEEETVMRKAASDGGDAGAGTECPSATPKVGGDAEPSREAFRKRPRPMNNLTTTGGIPPPPQANHPLPDSTVESPASAIGTTLPLRKDLRCISSASDASWADQPAESAQRESRSGSSPAKEQSKRAFRGGKSKVTGEVLSGWL